MNRLSKGVSEPSRAGPRRFTPLAKPPTTSVSAKPSISPNSVNRNSNEAISPPASASSSVSNGVLPPRKSEPLLRQPPRHPQILHELRPRPGLGRLVGRAQKERRMPGHHALGLVGKLDRPAAFGCDRRGLAEHRQRRRRAQRHDHLGPHQPALV